MEEKEKKENTAFFASWATLYQRWREGTFREILDDWKWILTYSGRHKKAIALYVILGVASVSLGMASSLATMEVIGIVTGYRTDRLGLLVVLMVGTALISLGFESILSRISTKLSILIHNDIQADIFGQILDADWLELGKFSTGDILNRFNSDIRTVSANAISWLPSIVISLYRFVLSFGLIWSMDPVMALIAFSSAPLLLVLSRFVLKRQRAHGQKVREAGSRLMSFESEAFSNFDTIKSFGAAPLYGRKLRHWQGRFRDINLEYNLFTIVTNALVSILGMLVQFLAFGYCLFQVWSGGFGFDRMTFFLQQRSKLSSTFSSLTAIVPAFLNSAISAHRIRELVELPKEVHIPESGKLNGEGGLGFTVELENLDFAYEENRPVIASSHLIAGPGEIVALVGPSGEGKTTLIRLILGLIRPQEGWARIRSTEGDVSELNADTRHLFAYVPQGNTILSGTLAENLRLGRENATEEEMVAALKTACAWDFVSKMPQGIHSSVGERGRGLSEGQAQRIAIARAVLRDAPVLLLDEATSALDVATERQVLRSIMQNHPNKTCIVTTHRPSVLNLCHRVYRVVDTRVTELSEEESSKMVMEF